MGLERLASVVQRVPNDFETDLFRPIMDKACELVGVKYGEDPKKDMAVKVISDHIRASAFMIADGILPTNDGGGYVLRRLIRRCVRLRQAARHRQAVPYGASARRPRVDRRRIP